MSENQTAQEAASSTSKVAQNPARNPKHGRRTLRTLGRQKRALKLKTDKEFSKTFFAAKAKRRAERKLAYRKKKSGKKA